MRSPMRATTSCLATLALAALGASAGALRAQAVGADTVAPGIVHYELVRPEGPWRVQVVTVDLRGGRYRILTRHAAGGAAALAGRQRTGVMAARLDSAGDTVLAAINADFFDLATGENENNQVVDGRVLKGVPVSDSPWNTFRNPHSQFAVDERGRPLFERFAFEGTIAAGPAAFRLDDLNGIPRGRDGLGLFTAEHGALPLMRAPRRPGAPVTAAARDPDAPAGPPAARAGATADSGVSAVEVPLAVLGTMDGSARYRVAGAPRPLPAEGRGGDTIAPGTARLVAYGAARPRLDSILARTRVLTARFRLVPRRGSIEELVGGWPRLVVDGRSVAAGADSAEGTFPSFSAKRHARSGIAVSRDSATLFLVVVDGLTPGTTSGPSVGMSLPEFADQLIALGAYQALNLDGGGSSTLLAGGRIVNRPSDPGGERAVGNALFVVRTPGR